MNKFISDNKPLIFRVLGVLLLVVLALWLYKRLYKFSKVPYPDKGEGLPAQWETKGNELVDELFDVIDGVTDSAVSKERAFAKLLTLTNDQLVYVYNTYNQKYGKQSNETLTEAIEGEWIWNSTPTKQAIALLKKNNLL